MSLSIRAGVPFRVERDPARKWLPGELSGFVSCDQLLENAALDVVVVVRGDHDKGLTIGCTESHHSASRERARVFPTE
jgi:hypothetical protein